MSKKPNIIFIMTDDHAAQAMSCYDSKINETPNLDRIANEGMRFDNCFCTNSICTPSRATILTGKHSHMNGVKTLHDTFDSRQQSFPKMLQKAGYKTAVIGKWHLTGARGQQGRTQLINKEIGSPFGFDYWNVLPGQGDYYNPEMIEMGQSKTYNGYATDIITDISLQWMQNLNDDNPFCLLLHHKAPHRPWKPDSKHKDLYKNEKITIPDNFYDNYENRAKAAKEAKMRIERDFSYEDLKLIPPEGVNANDKIPFPFDLENFSLQPKEKNNPVTFSSQKELKEWLYQRYIKDYLRCVASVDDNVGRVLDYLDKEGLTEYTIVIYT